MKKITKKAKHLQRAVETFINRKNREIHPEGEFDSKKRFCPSAAERQSCCDSIRTPSARFPFSLMVHCRTIQHIAHLFDIDVKDLRKAVRAVQPTKREGGENYFKMVAFDATRGLMLSIFDGETIYRIGETVKQRARQNHNGGIYVYASERDASRVQVPSESKLKGYPRVMIRVHAEGSYCRYENKLSFSQITPLAIVGVKA